MSYNATLRYLYASFALQRKDSVEPVRSGICDLPREKGPNAEKINFLFLILIEKSFFPLSNGVFKFFF